MRPSYNSDSVRQFLVEVDQAFADFVLAAEWKQWFTVDAVELSVLFTCQTFL